jgi:two-component system, NarL family, sensor kinase
MYIFAYDYDGKALALPYSPSNTGTNQIGLTDSTGFRFVQQMRDTAKAGKGGFVKYSEADLMNKGVITKKVSYVTDVDGNYWIGAGVYMSDEKKPAPAIVAKPTAVKSPVDVNATMPAANGTVSNTTAVSA